MEVVGSIVGGSIAADGAEDAANIQAASTDRANAIAEKQFEAIRNDLAPYRGLGEGASNMLAMYLGLPGGGGSLTGSSRPRRSLEDFRAELSSQYAGPQVGTKNGLDPLTNLVWINGRPHTYTTTGENASDTVYTPVDMPQQSAGVDIDAMARQRFDAQEAEFARMQQEAQAMRSDPRFGSLLQNFTGKDLENEPGYKFGLDQGMQALDRRLASGGNYFSGAALKGGQRFAQDYASTKFTDAFNRDSANKTRTYNFLTGATGIGQNAAAQTGNAGTAMAQQVGANTTAMGNAAGAARIAEGNAWSGAINNAVGGYNQNELLKRITGGNVGWGTPGYGMGPMPGPAPGLGSSFDQFLAR